MVVVARIVCALLILQAGLSEARSTRHRHRRIARASAAVGYLQVVTSDRVLIAVDGAAPAGPPRSRLTLPVGMHEVALALDGDVVEIFPVRIRPGQTLRVEKPLPLEAPAPVAPARTPAAPPPPASAAIAKNERLDPTLEPASAPLGLTSNATPPSQPQAAPAGGLHLIGLLDLMSGAEVQASPYADALSNPSLSVEAGGIARRDLGRVVLGGEGWYRYIRGSKVGEPALQSGTHRVELRARAGVHLGDKLILYLRPGYTAALTTDYTGVASPNESASGFLAGLQANALGLTDYVGLLASGDAFFRTNAIDGSRTTVYSFYLGTFIKIVHPWYGVFSYLITHEDSPSTVQTSGTTRHFLGIGFEFRFGG
jgi:hypothetical protein